MRDTVRRSFRAGKITYDDAMFAMRHEIQWAKDHISGDALRNAGSNVMRMIEFVGSKIPTIPLPR